MAKIYGPYKGSKQNGGRKIMVERKADGSTTSTNAARYKKEKAIGKKLSKTQHVDHKDNNKGNDSAKNLNVTSRKKNIGKENKRRVGKRPQLLRRKPRTATQASDNLFVAGCIFQVNWIQSNVCSNPGSARFSAILGAI